MRGQGIQKRFLRSMYDKYIFWLVNFASSSVAIISCSCPEVLLSALKPSWLSCSIWCCSPCADNMLVKVLVKSLYIVFAKAIGL